MESTRENSNTTDRDNASQETRTQKPGPSETLETKPSIIKKIWNNVGMDLPTAIMMFKGACPPLIATAMYQATPVAQTFVTLGYLVSIMSILSLAFLPRSKFFQNMVLNTIGVCIGAAVALLAIFCSVQGRLHTSPPPTTSKGPTPGTAVTTYNSSASAVSAIFLFVNILTANAFRASRPSLQMPVIIYSIFANVACTYSPTFPTMAAGIVFVKRLLEAFLSGFAIAFGVNLFVLPFSSRDVVFKDLTKYINAIRGSLKAEMRYLHALEEKDVFSVPSQSDDKAKISQPTQELKASIASLVAIHGKLHGDLSFAKREVAYGKLCADDLEKLRQLLKGVLSPVLGTAAVSDILDRAAERRGWKASISDDDSQSRMDAQDARRQEVHEWNDVFKAIHEPFESIREVLDHALQHVLYTLELEKRPRSSAADQDLEAHTSVKPGDPGFSVDIEKKIEDFYNKRQNALRVWCGQKGIQMPKGQFHDHPQNTVPIFIENETADQHKRNKRQLYLILYLEYLLHATGTAVVNLVQFADSKVADQTMTKRRVIVPSWRRLKKWIHNAIKEEEDSAADHTPDSNESGVPNIYIGDSLRGKRKDPEHLAPRNAWERLGQRLLAVPRVLESPAAAFGFRVACATMSIGIIAYLEASQSFFLRQRLVWAMIMVAIGMTVTTGSGVFGFLGRVGGTFIAMCMSLIIWYIAGGRGAVGGVLPLLFVAIALELYFLIRIPRFTPVVIITMVTQVLILGYELEVDKIGVATAMSNGQPYYTIYELAPYRLATVAGGCFVGFIWLYFPYPLTARSQLRKDLGSSLYLLANYYSCVHATTRMRLRGDHEDLEDKSSPAYALEKARTQLASKEFALLAALRQHSSFTAFEFNVGGKFPKETYDTIIEQVQNLVNYISLIFSSTQTLLEAKDSPDENTWIHDMRRLLSSVTNTTQEVTSTLALLSASVSNGSPLPPYLKLPEPYGLSDKLEAIDRGILSLDHAAEEGYASFAVTQIASSLISEDLSKLVENVKTLVGEVNFTWGPMEQAMGMSGVTLAESGGKAKRE